MTRRTVKKTGTPRPANKKAGIREPRTVTVPEKGLKKPGKPGTLTPRTAKTQARRDALRRLIQTRGLSRFDVIAFAREQKVNRDTVYADLKAMAAQVTERAVELVVLSALERLRRADEEYLAIMEQARDAGESGVRLNAANALRDSALREIDTLQRLGKLKAHTASVGEGGVTLRVVLGNDVGKPVGEDA